MAPTGAQGVKMSVRPSICPCDILQKRPLKRAFTKRELKRESSRERAQERAQDRAKEKSQGGAQKKELKRAIKRASIWKAFFMRSEPCPVGACFVRKER